MRIRFLSNQIYESGGVGKGPKFPSGFVLDESGVQRALGMETAPSTEWAQSFLHRWLQRGVAEEVDGRTPATDLATPEKNGAPPASGATLEPTALELIAMASAKEVPFMTFLAEAKGKLGDKTPAKKAEIIVALYGTMTIDELKALAAERQVDLGTATGKDEIVEAIYLNGND